jgi:heptosyltransferase-1
MPDGVRENLLIVRLGAMGDILHALPAAASLRRSFPDSKLVWITKPKWLPLFEGNPLIDEVVAFDRSSGTALLRSWQAIRKIRPSMAFDFQGLIQSALVGRLARPRVFWGLEHRMAREPLAALLYTHRAAPVGPHRIERNLQLIQAAGARVITDEAWIPVGKPEGELPAGPFVLASPFAGWAGKQWPITAYQMLGKRLAAEGLQLVLNVVSRSQAVELGKFSELRTHTSSIAGLIDATRRATAVVGVDSGPLHLAAALRKPGVALFGPTDPASNGPYGGSMTVLRSAGAVTSYARQSEIQASMKAIAVESVVDALRQSMQALGAGAGQRR